MHTEHALRKRRPPARSPDDPRLARIAARDPTADGSFWYAVTTTGVYCRPACPSRAARPEHIRLFDTREAAESAGFRPCRRCNPRGLSADGVNAEIVARACRTLARSDEAPSLSALAAAAELNPSHFQRVFKRVTGLSPKAYADAVRAERVRDGLSGSGTVTAAMLDAGYASPSRFYAAAPHALGMAPKRWRTGGVGETLRFAVGACALGAILVASSEKGIAAILLGDDPDALVRDLQDRFRQATLVGGDADYERLVARVIAHVERARGQLDLPLDLRGTVFQKQVWHALKTVPAGAKTSYSEIAVALGAPKAVRAVAMACAANHIAVVIPCHRVVRRDGELSGYRWGIERKRILLDREAARGGS